MNRKLEEAPTGQQGQVAPYELRMWRLVNTLLALALGFVLLDVKGAVIAGAISAVIFVRPEIWPPVARLLAGRRRS